MGIGRLSSGAAPLRKGAWTPDEDLLLKQCIDKHGEGRWHEVPGKAGLNRCRKSCRLRWLNYLKPSIKRGEFATDEVDLILRLHKLLGNRWSLIAGRIPGRTANDIKNYWNTHLRRKREPGKAVTTSIVKSKPVRPQPRILRRLRPPEGEETRQPLCQPAPESFPREPVSWWEDILFNESETMEEGFGTEGRGPLEQKAETDPTDWVLDVDVEDIWAHMDPEPSVAVECRDPCGVP